MTGRMPVPTGHPGYTGVKGLPKEQRLPAYPGLKNNIMRFREHIHKAFDDVQSVQRRIEIWQPDEVTKKVLRAQNDYLRDYWMVLGHELWPMGETTLQEQDTEPKPSHPTDTKRKKKRTLTQEIKSRGN